MSYFEEINESNSVLKRILKLLAPLGIVTGAGSNRLNVDVTAVNAVTTVTTVTTVSTLSALTNQVNTGGVNSFVILKDQSRNAYANGIRNNLTFY
jgi:hypothetical protein